MRWQRKRILKNSLILVGAAGFEPTTSLEFRQGALTAELHAYISLLKSMGSIESAVVRGLSSKHTASSSRLPPATGTSCRLDSGAEPPLPEPGDTGKAIP